MEELFVTNNFNIDSVLSLWESIFGKDEALLEKIQIDGTEEAHNTDFVYTAVENEEILGTIHITVPKKIPEFGGISGVCTSPFARGKGVAKTLFSKGMDEMRKMGVKVAFLGTNNQIAAKLYASYGFSFLSGSNVMVRCFDESYFDYIERLYNEQSEIHIVDGTPDFRIPIIPLVNHIENQIVLDVNTGITSRTFFTQKSCMGLFPRYIVLKENGGSYYGAVNKNNLLGAIMSVKLTEFGMRADFFCCDSFAKALPEFIKKCEDKYGAIYFQIANADKKKAELIKESGFLPCEEVLHPFDRNCFIPMTIFRR